MPRRTIVGRDGRDTHRVSVTLSKATHAELDRLAAKQGMTVSWIVRRAAEQFVERENGGPTLPFDRGQSHA
jgi:metal-responsive CopG/Arc/MetJ family transcriptional regulator